METYATAFSIFREADVDICCGNIGARFVRPLNEADAIAQEILFKPCIQKFIRVCESIKIKVIQRNSRNSIRFDQGVGGALYTALVAECSEQAACERGLACAEVATEPDHEAGFQGGNERGAELFRCVGIGQMQGERFRLIIARLMQNHSSNSPDAADLASQIRAWGHELGFDAVGIAGIDLSHTEQGLLDWLAAGFHGDMDYMARHGLKRARPAELVPGTVSVISARMNYWPEQGGAEAEAALADGLRAVISRYALGRDYHKLLRSRLQKLADRIGAVVGEFGYRVFVDSAPVMEVALAEQAGLGWRGKHTLLLNREAGSLFFLGEIFVDIALPPDGAVQAHCGSCTRCIDVCPTQAIVAPYKLDARRCISYLTIELKGSIPVELRPLIGNRIYGCDDCQLVCPWNRFAQQTQEADFTIRNGMDCATLVELFAWSEAEFEARMPGSAIYRIGYERWLRNLAVGLGNAPSASEVIAALRAKADCPSELVREHVAWALQQHLERSSLV